MLLIKLNKKKTTFGRGKLAGTRLDGEVFSPRWTLCTSFTAVFCPHVDNMRKGKPPKNNNSPRQHFRRLSRPARLAPGSALPIQTRSAGLSTAAEAPSGSNDGRIETEPAE